MSRTRSGFFPVPLVKMKRRVWCFHYGGICTGSGGAASFVGVTVSLSFLVFICVAFFLIIYFFTLHVPAQKQAVIFMLLVVVATIYFWPRCAVLS